MTRYFKISHYREGKLYGVYGVETNGSIPHESNLVCYGDEVKYYEPITKREFDDIMGDLK